ncbi:hypothetical protein NE237_006640 [Protea cynaroides]|uniref:Protein RIK n=1 Tax=Protea cynaroides TaxID=273540 RepID=A0A9Q0KMX2_9MAGN|nr:hypothetical protein NE237_006640 [Protea cynaroides]
MTEDGCLKVSEESMATAAATRQRRKRKWDQPAEYLISAGLQVPGVLPLGNVGSLVGVALPGMTTPSGALLTNPLSATCTTAPHIFQPLSIPLNTSAVVQKLNQPKIQDELIAREIVINDAETSIRYKLTKRQTQEEIQKCTGAVVITRGKYRPPNSSLDGEKPLYLHISAGAHLKDTAERIKAVDRAAVMVEEMLKQGINMQPASAPFHSTNTGQITQPLSTCVFLGFDADPTLNIAARIRGPNDQYINHIMNETGATVALRGQGSSNFEGPNGQELAQPLHLFLSCNSLKSFEDAKRLAENLLDTIGAECGVSRVPSSKVYNAVPPPQQLLAGVQSSGNEQKQNLGPVAGLTSSAVGSTPIPPVSSITVPEISGIYPQATVSQPGRLPSYGLPQSNMVCYPQSAVTGGTRYSGYEGIYPQATPLQQVALALRQSSPFAISATAPVVSEGSTLPKANPSSKSEEKRPVQKRKFQELPVASKGPAKPLQNSLQGSEFLKPGTPPEDLGMRNISSMPPPKKLFQPSSNGIPLPRPRTMPPLPTTPSSRTMPPPPPPPPKFMSSISPPKANGIKSTSVPVPVPDTLIKLMEYGDEDDEPDEITEDSSKSNSAPKPFWAV